MKILIVKTSSLGDIVHTLPALTDAKTALPNISFDWVVEEKFAEVPSWHPAVANIIQIAWRRWRKNIFPALFSGELTNFIRLLRAKKYDLIIDAQGLLKSALLTKIAHGISCGYDRKSIREPLAAHFYQHRFSVTKATHAITRIRSLFALSLHYPLPTTQPNYLIDTTRFPPPSRVGKYLVFLHGSSNPAKCWSELEWRKLANFATTNGYIVYLPWGDRQELERAHRIATQHNQIKVLPSLPLLALAVLLQNAAGIVAVDSGLGHIAAALGTPTLSLYGPTRPNLIGTVGSHTLYLQNMDQLAADEVWHHLIQILLEA